MQVFPFMFFTDQDARYMIGRMSRVRHPVSGIGHLFRIAMVGDDQELAMDGASSFDDLADAGIDRFNGLDSGFKDARMADHIGIGEIEHDHVIFIGLICSMTFSVTIGAFISGCKS